MPIINNVSNTQNANKKSKIIEETNTLPKPKRLVKTEAYYSDLINNKLITINPVWLENKRLKKCSPKFKAIKNVNLIDKKLKGKKNIKKN